VEQGASRVETYTYIRLAGRWVYAYRAIDEDGQVIDCLPERHARYGGSDGLL